MQNRCNVRLRTVQAILDDELIQTLKWYNMPKLAIIFQHDNDPKHTSNSTNTVSVKKNSAPQKTVKLKFIDSYWKVLRDIIVVADLSFVIDESN